MTDDQVASLIVNLRSPDERFIFQGGSQFANELADLLNTYKVDVERYRWLRGDACPDHSVRWTQWEVRCWVAPFWSDDLRREGLDRSIDAARAADQSERRKG